MLLRFAGFELDRQRAELRGPDGEIIKLRPKTLGMLALFAANPKRVLSKRELMDAVWPDVHVGEDNLFQCIREIRTALRDDRRQLIKVISGLGYLLEAEVLEAELSAKPVAAEAQAAFAVSDIETSVLPLPSPARRWFRPFNRAAFTVLGFGAALGLFIVTAKLKAVVNFGGGAPAVTVMPIASDGDGGSAEMAANVTIRLADGLAKIENIRAVAPQTAPRASATPQADFAVSGDLRKGERSWEMRARMVRIATGEVVWTAPVSVAVDDTEHIASANPARRRRRLCAGPSHQRTSEFRWAVGLDRGRFAAWQRQGRNRAGHRFYRANIAGAVRDGTGDAGKGARR